MHVMSEEAKEEEAANIRDALDADQDGQVCIRVEGIRFGVWGLGFGT